MKTQVLHIKNMVCPRCKTAVNTILSACGIAVITTELGEVTVVENPDTDMRLLDQQLREQGFELIFDKEHMLVEQIKNQLLIYLENIQNIKIKISDFLAEALHSNYAHLSKVFSAKEHITLEKYWILLKIEKVKEWLSYEQYSLSEIADLLMYSSVQALSNQFKSVLGLTVSQFRLQIKKDRKPFDKLH